MSNLLTHQSNFRLPPRHQARQHPATAAFHLRALKVPHSLLNQIYRCHHLARVAVQVSSGGADAAVPGQRFQNMNRCALVGQVGQKSPAAAVAAGSFKARTLVDQGKCLRQAVGVEPQLDTFLAREKRVVAVHARGLRSVGLQLRFEFGADKHGARMPALGHVG